MIAAASGNLLDIELSPTEEIALADYAANNGKCPPWLI